MATVHTTALIDDLDGSPAQESVYFGVDGTRYVIDLTHDHADQLRERLTRFIAAARPVTPPAQRPRRTRAADRAAGGPSAQDLRAWAAAHGMVVNPMGPIPLPVRDRYRDTYS